MILIYAITSDPKFFFDLYIFIYLIRILTILFIYSLYNEGGSNRIYLPSYENHIEFSIVRLQCPAESPPFHFPVHNSSQLRLTTLHELWFSPSRFLWISFIPVIRPCCFEEAFFIIHRLVLSNFDWYSYAIATDSLLPLYWFYQTRFLYIWSVFPNPFSSDSSMGFFCCEDLLFGYLL